ncbi:hypothetical protein NMD1_02700 [Novosphingobium sp. MD-1]|nr:hypothetical protein NMD1_02700 [Novosphingobium sp. MD-1]
MQRDLDDIEHSRLHAFSAHRGKVRSRFLSPDAPDCRLRPKPDPKASATARDRQLERGGGGAAPCAFRHVASNI